MFYFEVIERVIGEMLERRHPVSAREMRSQGRRHVRRSAARRAFIDNGK